MKNNIRIMKAAIWVLAAVCGALCLFGPKLVDSVVQCSEIVFRGALRWWIILLAGYALALAAFLCLRSLYVLLNRLERGEVFVRENVRSLCTVEKEITLAGVISLLLGITCLPLMLAVAAVILFAALVVRVVRSAFEEAVRMQDELDYTV